ncbi:MAG TPA: LysR family transcriptional regulator [Polyangiaceae bacterium]|jgi:DNA-binding transcriptional LysR family regulator|nr:LysR family transcriptional regulator [Polyangiaceae bacterium]
MDLLDKMATFVRVVEAGSFSTAAKQLRISAAAVSRQIATLEGELGSTLLERSTRRMSITASGRRYYERCLAILRDVEDAQNVARARAVEGLLVVSTPVTFGLARVVPYLPTLMTKHAGIRIDLRLEDHLVDLALDGIDVAIRVGGALPEALIAHPLFSFRRITVASPDYTKRRGEPKTPEALARHDALAYAPGPAADTFSLSDGERETRVRVNVKFRSNALHAVRDLALSGSGVALLPDWLVAGDVKSGALRRVLPSWTTDPVTVHALHRTIHRGSPRVKALVEHLRTAYANDP